ncbi:MAG: hypothetical protein F7C38_04440 [Desulfurococcales archaeon]|nr:hypothetical protein [Desulfurococcales archaeon]
MRVRIIAADSMGVRSLATVVEVSGVVIGLDLGASIAPRRYGLPPHEMEWKTLERALDEARRWIRESHVVTITHYHYDHYMRDEPDLYRGKILAVKDPRRNINRSQAIRSYVFLKKLGVEELADVRIADGRFLEFEGVRIEFSPPVWHGEPGTRVGRLVMVRILSEEGAVIFTSDVQGPADPEALRVLEGWSRPRPDIVIVGGPPTYFAGFKVPVKAVEAGLAGLKRVITLLQPRVVVVDHHLLRDINYSDKIAEHYDAAKGVGVRLVTGAEFMGRPVNQLEARRRGLWRESSG